MKHAKNGLLLYNVMFMSRSWAPKVVLKWMLGDGRVWDNVTSALGSAGRLKVEKRESNFGKLGHIFLR